MLLICVRWIFFRLQKCSGRPPRCHTRALTGGAAHSASVFGAPESRARNTRPSAALSPLPGGRRPEHPIVTVMGSVLLAAFALGMGLTLPQACSSQNIEDGHMPVLLSDIDVLVFRDGEYTSSRVGNVIPKLNDIGDLRTHPKVTQIVCRSVPTRVDVRNNTSIGWNCSTTDLGLRYSLANTHVSCEGWSGPGDVYVVPGSCSIEYEVVVGPDFELPEAKLSLGPESLYRVRRWKKHLIDNLMGKRPDDHQANARLDDL